MIARPSRALLWPSAREPVPRSISCSLRAPACLFEARLQPESTIPRRFGEPEGPRSATPPRCWLRRGHRDRRCCRESMCGVQRAARGSRSSHDAAELVDAVAKGLRPGQGARVIDHVLWRTRLAGLRQRPQHQRAPCRACEPKVRDVKEWTSENGQRSRYCEAHYHRTVRHAVPVSVPGWIACHKRLPSSSPGGVVYAQDLVGHSRSRVLCRDGAVARR